MLTLEILVAVIAGLLVAVAGVSLRQGTTGQHLRLTFRDGSKIFTVNVDTPTNELWIRLLEQVERYERRVLPMPIIESAPSQPEQFDL